MIGGVGNDHLFLGDNDGATDTVIYELADGQDTVFEFELGSDKIQLGSQLDSQFLNLEQNGNDTIISYNDSPLAILSNVDSSGLAISAFL